MAYQTSALLWELNMFSPGFAEGSAITAFRTMGGFKVSRMLKIVGTSLSFDQLDLEALAVCAESTHDGDSGLDFGLSPKVCFFTVKYGWCELVWDQNVQVLF